LLLLFRTVVGLKHIVKYDSAFKLMPVQQHCPGPVSNSVSPLVMADELLSLALVASFVAGGRH
jgi:hypothetical protein